MKRISAFFLILCFVAGQHVCFADYEDVQVFSSTDKNGKETTTYMGGTENDRDLAIVLGSMATKPTTRLVKYVFAGSGSDTVRFSIAEANISTKAEMYVDDSQRPRLNVTLLDEEGHKVKNIGKLIGPVSVYDNFSVKDGKYTIEISQNGPGDWEVFLIFPGSTYFLSSDYASKSIFYEP